MTYRINTHNGFIHCPDGYVCKPPYGDEDLSHYLEYATWVQSGNSPEEFIEVPPEPVPDSVSRFQARAALYQSGYLEQVEAIMQSPDTPMLSKLAWQDALSFERNSTTVLTLSSLLGMSDEQLDNLFRLAGSIKA
jgi:hypothetical protein